MHCLGWIFLKYFLKWVTHALNPNIYYLCSLSYDLLAFKWCFFYFTLYCREYSLCKYWHFVNSSCQLWMRLFSLLWIQPVFYWHGAQCVCESSSSGHVYAACLGFTCYSVWEITCSTVLPTQNMLNIHWLFP